MNRKAELNIPEDKLKIALVTTIVLFVFVFILVILAIIFSPGEIQKFISNPLGGGNENALEGGALKADIGNVSIACSDSDGGQEFGTEGFVINASGSIFEDNCTSSETLREYYCMKGNVTFTSTICANSCISGACSDYNWTCTDSDGGINLNKSGNIAGVQLELNRLSFASDSCLASPTNSTKVSSGEFINEYFCSGKYINSSVYGCSSGCMNGICNGTASLLNCKACLTQNKNYSCFSGSSVSCSLTFDATKCFDCRNNKCGNGVCDYGESFLTCNKDCNLLSCGNGRCDNPFENEGNCPTDCLYHCGNGVCDDGENLNNCAIDCGVNKTHCGNGVCEPPVETLTNCAKDCNNLCSGGGSAMVAGATVGGSGSIGTTAGTTSAGTAGSGTTGTAGTGTETMVAPANSCSILGQKKCISMNGNGIFQVCMNYTGNSNWPNRNGLFWGGSVLANACGYAACTGDGECTPRPASYYCGSGNNNKLVGGCNDYNYQNVVEKDAVCSGTLIGSKTLSNYKDCSSYCGNLGGTKCYLQSSSGSPNCKCYSGLNINAKCNGVQVAFTNNVANSAECSKYCTNSRASCSSYGSTSGINGVNCVCYSGSSALSDWEGGTCMRTWCADPCPDGSYHDVYGDSSCVPYQYGCTPGQKRCNGNGYQTCSSSGNWGSTITSCGTGKGCDNGVCKTVAPVSNLVDPGTCPTYCGNLGASCFVASGVYSPNCECYSGSIDAISDGLSENDIPFRHMGWSGGNCANGICTTSVNEYAVCSGSLVSISDGTMCTKLAGNSASCSGNFVNSENLGDYNQCSSYCGNLGASCFIQNSNHNPNCECYSGSFHDSPYYSVGNPENVAGWSGGNCGFTVTGRITASVISGNVVSGGITGNAIKENSITGNAVSSSSDYCGDGRCSTETCETTYNCPNDCKGSVCGNNICEFGETYTSCSRDCKINTCGNGVCDYGLESANTCPSDCIIFCGNGVCESSSGENSQNCQVDCLGGICNKDEDCFTGMSCVNHVCVQSSCTIDANCHTGEKCINSVCLSECTTNSDCGAGKQCKEGFCNLIGTLTVNQPNGGETLIRGQTYDIKWSVSTGVNRISLYLISNSVAQKTIISGTSASSGKYSWTVPSNSIAGQYKIKIVNSADNNIWDSSNDWFSISAPANALPRLNSITPSNGKPGDLITIFGEGFDSSANRVIFKILDSPFSFYNSKTGVEYLIGAPIASTDGKTLQFSIPSTLNQLDSPSDSSSSITTVPGNYQIIVSNSSSGAVRSNALNFLVNNYLNLPTKINITSPKAGDVWNVGEQKTITWVPISNLPKANLYVNTRTYRSSTNDLESVYFVKKINLSITQSRGSFDWNIVDFGEGDKVSSTYSSAEQLYDLPWIPLNGSLESYVQISGIDTTHNVIYKDTSENFTLDTNVQGSCNSCPAEGYSVCDGSSSRKNCGKVGDCLTWSSSQCASGETCSNGVCVSSITISGTCVAGQKRCSGNGYQTCVAASANPSCGDGVAAVCVPRTTTVYQFVNGVCTSMAPSNCGRAGATFNSLSECQSTCGSSAPSTSWGTTTACPTGQTCSNGVCGVGAGGACSKYPGAWYQISPPGSIGCEEFCTKKGLTFAPDFTESYMSNLKTYSTLYENGQVYDANTVEGRTGESACHTSDFSQGTPGIRSINPEFNVSKYNDISKIPGAVVWVGFNPGYATSSSEYGYLWWCSYSVTQGAVDKCYCRDITKDVTCPSGLYCSGEASGVCTKPVCGNGKCEEGETASSCGNPLLPKGCVPKPRMGAAPSNVCTKQTFYRGNCEVDCNPDWWTPGMPESSQPCNVYYGM